VVSTCAGDVVDVLDNYSQLTGQYFLARVLANDPSSNKLHCTFLEYSPRWDTVVTYTHNKLTRTIAHAGSLSQIPASKTIRHSDSLQIHSSVMWRKHAFKGKLHSAPLPTDHTAWNEWQNVRRIPRRFEMGCSQFICVTPEGGEDTSFVHIHPNDPDLRCTA